MRRSRRTARLLLAVVALTTALVTAGAAQAAITPVTNDAAGATALAAAMTASPANVTGASFDAVPPSGTPHGISDGLNEFPTNGPTFAIMTSGDVNLADDPNTSDSSGANLGGGNVRGDTDFDVTILKVNVNVPVGANCLRFDFKFLSDEFPEYVNTEYNDAFIAELDSSTWTTSGSTISAPNNFAFDPSGNVVSINSSGNTAMSLAEASGTTYDGATPLLSAATQVTPGAHALYLSIFDQGDQIYDSAVFLDNLVIGFVPNPETQCAQGAQPVSHALTLDPAADTNPVGTSHTVTATLTESGNPVANATISFTVTGANPTSGTGTTNASGEATFTYTGANAGDDTIVACYDADANSTCGNAGDPIASATKTWEPGQPTDTTDPSCELTATGTDSAGKKYIEVTAEDDESGIASILVTKSTNANTVVPPFTPGTTDPVVVRGTKINNSKSSSIELRVTDVAGNVTVCDPVITLVVREAGKPESQTHTGIPAIEHNVLIENGDPGVNRLDVTVNGQTWKLTGLKAGQVSTLDVASAMNPGNDNTITLTAYGKPGASALVVISD